jgi:hypothetical protein
VALPSRHKLGRDSPRTNPISLKDLAAETFILYGLPLGPAMRRRLRHATRPVSVLVRRKLPASRQRSALWRPGSELLSFPLHCSE